MLLFVYVTVFRYACVLHGYATLLVLGCYSQWTRVIRVVTCLIIFLLEAYHSIIYIASCRFAISCFFFISLQYSVLEMYIFSCDLVFAGLMNQSSLRIYFVSHVPSTKKFQLT